MKSKFFSKQEIILFFILFGVMCANYLGISLAGNEENYFAVAKHFIDPAWGKGVTPLDDVPGTRLAFQFIAGYFLKFFSFEALCFWGRFMNFFFLSVFLAKICSKLKLGYIEAFFFLQVLFIIKQSFYGGEGIISDLESKTLAYIFVFWSFYALLQKKHFKSVIIAALSVYFHILAGGWYSVILFLYLWIFELEFKKVFKYGLVFLVLVAPFITMLYTMYFVESTPVIDGVNINWIYTRIRNPHHIQPFGSYDLFMKKFFKGITVSLISYALCIFYFRKFENENIKMLNRLNLIIFTEQFIFLIVAIFDKNGDLLKYYPFRSSALSALFMYLQIMIYLKEYALPEISGRINLERVNVTTVYLSILLIISSSVLIIEAQKNYNENKDYLYSDLSLAKKGLYSYIRENTAQTDVFIFLTKDNDLSFIRNTERDVFSLFKFVPTENKRVYQWYVKLMENGKAYENHEYLYEIKKNYKIDYVVSSTPLNVKGLSLVYKNDFFNLYKL